MEIFPTLSVHPSKVTQAIEDATMRSSFEGGYEITRNKYTRDRSTFTVDYNTLERADKDLIVAFLKTVRGATPFIWENHDEAIPLTDPIEYKTYIVRFSSFPEIPAVGGKYGLYDISFEIKEV